MKRVLLLAVVMPLSWLHAVPVHLSGGGYHFAGVQSGQIAGLGDGTYGQLGSNPGTVPVVISEVSVITQVVAGSFNTIAL